MRKFIFDLQRFATQTISAGNTYALDGVTYTATTDAVLNLDNGKVSGIASGKVTAVVTGARNSPTATFDATDGKFNFTASGVDGAFVITGNGLGYMLSSGSLTMSADELEGNAGVQKLSFTKNSSISIGKDGKAINVVAKEDSTFHTWLADKSIIYCKLDGDSADFDVSLAFNGKKITGSTVTFGGRISYSPAQGTFALINDGKNPDTKDSFASFNLGNYKFQMATDGKTVVAGLKVADDGTISINYPSEDYNKTHLTVSRGDTPIFDGNLSVSDGSIGFNPATQSLSFTKGTKTVFTLGNYTFDFTATDDINSKVSIGADGSFILTPGENDGSLNVVLKKGDTPIFGGNLSVSDGSIGFNPATQSLSFTKGTKTVFTLGNYTFDFTATDDINSKVSIDADGSFILTPGKNDGSLNVVLKKGDTTLFGGNVSVSGGSIGFNPATQSLSFTKGTTTTLTLPNAYSMSLTTTDAASVKISADANGNFKITPSENDGALDITIKRGRTSIFSNVVSVVGEITFNPATQSISLADGTKMSVKFGNYEVTATADGDAAVSVAMTPTGLSITPVEGDGTLNLTLGNENGSMSVNLEVLSGSFILGENGALTVTKDTELQIDFGGGYVVKFKTTDDAGGSISLGAGGLTFTPTAGDGHLELSVTRGGETRTTSLEMTGSLTYKLDGSISLAKDTVLRNVFEDGNILTITANTAANGSIVFSPQNGITITPTAPKALNVLFTGGGGEVEVFNITSIDGSVTYKGGVITASDGTEVLFTNYYMDSEMKLSTDGGSSSLEITEDTTSYIANEGATFVLDYLDGDTLEISGGKFIDDYEHAIVTAGATFKTNDDEDYFYLQTAGNYTLNGMKVTTTSAMTPVILGEDSIILDDLTYKPLDKNVTLTIGTNTIACAGGKANVNMGLLGQAFDFDTTSGSFTFNRTNNTFSVKKGTVISMARGNSELQLTALEDTSATIRTDDEGIIYCDWADTTNFNLSLVRDGQTVITLPANVTGTASYLPSAGTLALVCDEANQNKNSSATIELANYKIQLATPDNTFVIGLETSDDGKLTISYPREEYSTMNMVVTRGDDTVFGGNVEVSGSVVLDPTNRTLTLKDGTSTEMTFGDYTLKATATGDATTAFVMDEKGLVITPKKGDGTLNLTLGSESGSMSVNLEVLSGSFILGKNGALTVTKGTELQIDFGGGYVVKFKATDAAGGSLSLGTDGITFTSNSDDGGLELSVTNGGVTRTTSLNMTGSLTYKLDGSISLAKGTVLRNVFEDGNELTITANADASGSIVFTPQNGLTITPATPDALNIKLTTGGVEVANISSISGTINYSGGVFTASDGAEVNVLYFNGEYNIDIKNTGNSSLIQFDSDRVIGTANKGATLVLDYVNGPTWNIHSETTLTKIYDAEAILSEGANFDTNDNISVFTLGTAGNYNLNGISVTTTKDNVQVQLSDYDTVKFGEDAQVNRATSISGNDLTVTASAKEGQGSVTVDDDGNVTYDATDGTLKISVPLEDVIGNSLLPSEFTISGGSITMGAINADATRNISITKGTALSFTKNGMTFDTVVQNDINGRLWMREGHIIYLHSYEEANFDTTITFANKKIFSGMVTLNGALSYNAANGTTGLVDSNTYNVHDSCMQVALGDRTLKLTTNGDTFFAVLDVDDNGKITFDFNNEKYNSMLLTVSTGDKDVLNGTLRVNGSIVIDPATQEISVTKGTVINLTQGDNELEITALDNAGGKLTLTESGIRFAPNAGDGALELNFVSVGRKVTLDVTGEFVYGSDGKISLEDGTEINLTWEDGNSLKLTSSGSTGSIAIDPTRGLKITSDDENLNMTFTTPAASTEISNIKGTIYYNAGDILFDENSKITATTTLGGQPIFTTLETIDGTGHISFNTTNGVLYAADTGAMKITWSRDDLESTFTVNSGSVQIGHNLFRITEGSDIATDLKNFVPALYFTTAEAGTYTINGQTIKTSTEGLALTATDDQMVFKTSGDVVEYDGMTFAGNGNVSLKADNVVLGAGVEAKGFGEENTFVLAEAGNVTADAKVFELTELDTPIKIPMEISVHGAQDGFTFSRTLTKESEAYLDDALTEEKFGNYSSSYIGQVFTEKFISAGDSSYRIRTDAIGLEEVIGISNGATITGGATLADEPTLSYYNLVTDTTGKFTIGERTYNVSGDSSIALRARFEENAAPYASMVDSLNGTISGDFSGGDFSINGSSALKVIGDTDISIVADKSGFEILGLDAGANLQVAAAGNYKVNGTEIAAGASSVIIGTADGKARLNNMSAELADFMLHKTAAGYPQMAVLAFHPDEENPAAPTNYHSAEKWTTTSTDDLQLSAIHYSPENPTGKWVILVHGYGKKGAAMNAFAEPYLAQGMDVLIVDQRTAGDSEGDWLTMGVAEANDLAIWTQEIAKTNANAQITLHGVSMGAATVMLAAALPETTNVSAMIEDCGYGNIADVFATLLTYYGSALGVSGGDYYKLFDDVAAVAKTLDGGYDVGDAAPIDSIAAVTVPSLFIHGAADVVIPSTNADALYNKSGARNKTKLIIEGAGHAKSVELDTEAYLTAVKKLVDSSTKEIGASIDSDADHKLLRGTIYNDTITNSGTTVTIQGLGGNDYIVNNVDSSLVAAELANSIDAGEGNDTIYSYHTYNPTLLGGAGDDSIVVESGHKTFADGGTGNDKIIGVSNVGGWGMGDYATILGGDGDDYIDPIYSANALIDGGNGNDTIFANGANATIDGGDGNNLIVMTDDEGGVKGKLVVLNGNTTVRSFNTGFGEGTDTIYIDGDPAGVYFKDGVLTFSNSTDSLTLSDVTTTAKVNIYHKRREVLNKGVFIADNDWYSVSSSDLSVSSGEEVYFVGPSATQNHGVDFSGITQNLNVTIDTAYIDSKDYVPGTSMWINGVYSIRGGAGNTTITGSDRNDTIIAGKGKTTIDGGKGDDYVSLNSAAALVEYRAGDGNDKIVGFRADSTLNISGSEYSKSKNGNDVIVNVGEEKITLSGAAKLSSLNIEGKQLPVSVEESIAYITNNYVANYYNYGEPITDQNQVKTLLDGDLNGDMALLLENKSADFSEYSGRKNVTLLGGENQSVTFNKEGHNTAIVDENTSGTKNIYLGGGGDLVFVEDTGARVNITASNGNDVIVSEGENVFVDLKGGKTDIFASGGKMTLNGYNASTNSGFGTNYSDILAAINNGEIYFDKGQMSVGSAVIDFNGVNSGVVNFFNLAGKMQKVGNAAPGESLDLSKETANFILAADKNSKLTAGAGDDTVFAYEGSRVDAGAGANAIYVKERDENASGVNIILSAGSTTIKNIHNTFDNGDIIEVAPENVSYNGKDLIISGENFKATVESPDKDSVAAYVNQLVKDSDGKTWKMAIGGENTVIDVKADEKLRADYYKAGGVTFENYGGKVQIDLSDGEDAWESFIGNKAAVFDGVTSVKAGAGDTTLKGSDANETFIAGNGNSSLYGAGGKNLLVGYEGEASLKEGSTTFFVLGVYETAVNTIQNFAFVNDYNYANKSADMIEIDTATNFIRQESIEVTGNDVAFSVENRNTGVTESVLVKNAASTSDNVKDMRFSDGVTAQVSTNDLCFDKFANFYVATGKNATVNVSNDTEYSKVWLDNAAAIENGSDANAIFVGDIRVIDATNSTVTAELAGNDLDNTILAGTGDSSLWGGNGGNDLLIGGESKNTFFYTLGNGNDTITNVNDGDIVDLAGVSLENIIGADFSNNALALNFSDGGKLTVNENGKGVNFVVGDQIFYVNNEHNGFVTKK